MRLKFKIIEDESEPGIWLIYQNDPTDDPFYISYSEKTKGFYFEEEIGDGTILDEDGEKSIEKVIDAIEKYYRNK